MLELLKQDLKSSPLCIVCLAGGWVTYLIDRGPSMLYPQAAYMLGFFLSAGILGAAITREARDLHGGGYRFLRTLPLTVTEIVQARFLASLFDFALSWLLALLLCSLLPSPDGILYLSQVYITFWSLGAFVVASLWYVLIYRFGFGTPTLVLTLLLLGFFLPLSLILDQALDFSDTSGFPSIVYSVATTHWLIGIGLASLSILLCFGLFRIAIVFKRRH